MPYALPEPIFSYPFPIVPITNKIYNNIVFIGSSTVQNLMGRNLVTPRADATSEAVALGYEVDVYGYGWSGFTVDGLIPKIQDAFDAFPTDDTLFIVEAGANDIVNYRPAAAMTQLQKDNFNNSLDTMFTLLKTRQEDCIPLLLAYRHYADPSINDDVFFDDSIGVKPFNDTYYLPRIQADFSNTLNVDNESIIDVYDYVRNDYPYLISTDGLHTRAETNSEYRKFMLGRLTNKFGGDTPTVITPAPTVDNGSVTYVSLGSVANIVGLNSFNETTMGGSIAWGKALRDADGKAGLPVISAITNYFSTTVGTGVLTGLSAFNGSSIFCTEVVSDSAFDGATKVLTHNLHRLEASTAYEFTFAASRSSGTQRITKITNNVTDLLIDTSLDPIDQTKKMVMISDVDGKIIFTQTGGNGQSQYLNGYSFKKV